MNANTLELEMSPDCHQIQYNTSLHSDDVALCVITPKRRLELGIFAHQVGRREEFIGSEIRSREQGIVSKCDT